MREGLPSRAKKPNALLWARAFLLSPRVLLLDEPTSSIDGETEEKIRHTLLTLKLHTTIMVTAHRMSTVRVVDRRAVLLQLQEEYSDIGPVAAAQEADLLHTYRAACQSVTDRLATLRGGSSEKRREVTLATSKRQL